MINVYKSSRPLVSVVMPTYNRASYFKRSICSVLNQTFTDWELVVVDDGSSDNTFEIVNEYVNQFVNVRYIKHSNRKTPLTINAGLLASCGNYITFLDSDDEYKPDHLKLRIDFMINNPSIDIIHGGIEIIGYPYVKDKNELSKEIHISECIVGGTFFGKRRVFFELDGFQNLAYSNDSDFLERAENKFNISKVFWSTYIYYRDTPDSICTTIRG